MSAARRLALMSLIVVAMTAAPTRAVDAPPRQQAAPAPPVFRRSIAQVIGDLTKEARDSWRTSQRWPREKDDYAREQGVTVDNDDLVRVLTRKLQPDASIDGYIKWQIMSFAPDFSQTTVDDYRRLIAVTPKVIDQPRPPPPPEEQQQQGVNAGFASIRQFAFVSDFQPVPGAAGGRPRLSVVNGGTGAGGLRGALSPDDAYGPKPEDIARAKASQVDRFAQVQRMTADANIPILAYRDALARELPDEGGVRITFLLQDATDRVAAGDPSFVPAVERLVLATDAIAANRAGYEVTLDLRRRLAIGIGQIAKMRTVIVTELQLVNGEPVAKQQYVNISPGVARRMLENLIPPEEPGAAQP